MTDRKPLLGSSKPLIPGPYDTRNAADVLNAEWTPLLDEINDSDALQEIKNYAERLNKDWQKFYTDVKEGWWYAGMNSTYEMVNEYRDRMGELRDKFIKTGGTTVTSRSPFNPPQLLPDMKPFKLGPVGWSVVGGGLLYLIYKLTDAKSKLVGAKSGLVRATLGKPKSHKRGRY